jgi:hypothetical protein
MSAIYGTKQYIKEHMNKNKVKKNFNNFEIYKLAISALLNNLTDSKSKDLLVEFINKLEILTEYMLVGKSLKAKPKKVVKVAKGNEKLSTEMKLYLGIIPLTNLDRKDPKISVKNLNLNDVVKFYKTLEQFMLRKVYINKVEELNLGKFIDTSIVISDSLPKLMISIDEMAQVEKQKYLNCLFSSIRIYRLFKTKVEPDSITITKPYSGTNLDLIISESFSYDKISEWLTSLKLNDTFSKKNLGLLLYSGNASSPNSKSSSSKLIEDLDAVYRDKNLWDAIINLAKNFKGSQDFISLINHLSDNIEYFDLENESPIHSRLFTFTAPGGKSRIIANVDWVTQTALSAIHFYLFKLLSKLPSDCTFNHKIGIKKLFVPNEKSNFYSIDLSAATDRMPRLIQAEILRNLFRYIDLDGDSIKDNWLKIVDREYSTANTKINNNNPVRYAVGQGMGLFTSWPIMALTHHYIVNKLCNISQSNYVLVGDDLLIKNDKEGFIKYLNFMNSIGVSVNMNKTLVSEDTTMPTLEFACNYVIDGININPLNYGILMAWNDKKTSFESFIYSLGDQINTQLCIELIKNFEIYKDLKQLSCVLYFLFKRDREDNSLITLIKEKFELPEWFLTIDYNKIYEIMSKTKTLQNNINSVVSNCNHFMSSSFSQLVVRSNEDVTATRDLASYLEDLNNSVLRISTTEMAKEVDMINAIFNRLISVQLIDYVADEFGNPLLSRKEHQFLSNLVARLKPKVKRKPRNIPPTISQL